MLRKDYKTNTVVHGRTICGYAAVFNNKDYAKDIIKPGAFAKSIKEQGPMGKNTILFLLQHDKKQILGKPTEMREDNTGLYIEAPIVPTTYGDDALALAKAGVLDGMSIGYEVVQQKEKSGYTELLQLKLAEFSMVTFPCNDLARVTDLKEDLYDAVEYGDEELGTALLKMLEDKYPGALSQDQLLAKEIYRIAEDHFGESDAWQKIIKQLETNLRTI